MPDKSLDLTTSEVMVPKSTITRHVLQTDSPVVVGDVRPAGSVSGQIIATTASVDNINESSDRLQASADSTFRGDNRNELSFEVPICRL